MSVHVYLSMRVYPYATLRGMLFSNFVEVSEGGSPELL